MNDIREMMVNTAEKLFRDHCTKELLHDAEKGVWPQKLWDKIEDLGFTTVGVEEEAGGTGGTIGDALSILKVLGKYGVPLPLAESMIGNWLMSISGKNTLSGMLTIAPVNIEDSFLFEKSTGGWIISGRARNIPFGRYTNKLVIIGDTEEGVMIAPVDSRQCIFQEETNIAGEPRDQVTLEKVFVSSEDVGKLPAPIHDETLYRMGALTRVAMMSGSLEKILEMSITYSMERQQFGKHIAKFQAIQQQLAILSGEVEAAKTATAYLVERVDSEFFQKEIMLAKIQVSHSVGRATSIAHQIHGAMGTTDEYPLHYFTRRLWAWREEFGNETQWASKLGQYILDEGPNNYWSVVLS